MNLFELSAATDDFFWSQVMIYGCLLAGVYFSVLMKFPQVRLCKDMVTQLFSGKSSASGVSSFQGFAMALGGRVGTGNITGVASAIFFGGPGAVFWMWAIAFLGAGSAFIAAWLSRVFSPMSSVRPQHTRLAWIRGLPASSTPFWFPMSSSVADVELPRRPKRSSRSWPSPTSSWPLSSLVLV